MNQNPNKDTRKKYRFLFITVLLLVLIAIIFAVLLALGVLRPGKNTREDPDTRDTAAPATGTTEDTTVPATETAEGGRVDPKIIENMAPATEVPGLTITDEMLEKGILNEGNPSRLMGVMERAARREEITIAYLGGSITAGSSASPQDKKCYAALSTAWWNDTFPEAKINYVNAGIGATDSWLGVHRVTDDVLSHAPDLVIVEYSVNDGQGWNKETYDSLLRVILESETRPAVISLLLAGENYGFASEHAPVAFRYKIPIISYSALLSGKLVSWKSVGNSDGTHPDNPGHALIARLLTEYYRRVLSGINETEDPGYTVPDLSESQTRCRYRNADLIFSDELTPDTAEGFEAAKVTPILSSDKGWKTTSAGSISFTVTTREIGIAWLQKSTDPDGICADYQLIIDGEPAMTLPGAATSWGPHLEYRSVLLDETASHKIELRPAEGSTGTDFEILALGILR